MRRSRPWQTVVADWCTVVYDGSMSAKHSPPSLPPAKVQAFADTNGNPPPGWTPHDHADRIRLTIPVSPRVHAAFKRISEATSVPVGRCMADWLRDTIDAAEYMADTLQDARAAPRLVAEKLHAYALGVTDETGSLLAKVRDMGKRGGTRTADDTRSAAGGGGADGLTPPVSNTGGKGTKSLYTRTGTGKGARS